MTAEASVLYHHNCPDGFGAAWAAWRHFLDRAEYVPMTYGRKLPLTLAPVVYLVDFCLPRPELERLAAAGHTVQVIDHHKTNAADAEGWPHAVFDMERSGAMLTWRFFHPATPIPKLIEYVQDRDLWRFMLPASRAVGAWLESWPYDFVTWTGLAQRIEGDFGGVAAEGGALVRFKAQRVKVMADSCRWIRIGGQKVPAANASVFFSEVGEELCLRNPAVPFAAYWFDRADGSRQWGLRSKHGFDVSEVAKTYGGGGHQAASGFQSATSWCGDGTW